jgi:2-keto-4-pentenoate hydratase/2-oxohepta-3-ene-1,7-dioic acid hydratase in catechol pathway
MKIEFQRLGALGEEVPAALIDGVHYDLRPITDDINARFFTQDPVSVVEAALPTLQPLVNSAEMRVGPPIAQPGAIYCIGMNYAKHAAEAGAEPPKKIVVFLKPPHTVAGPNDDFVAPSGMEKLDWEVELAVVIGKPAWRIASDEDPLDYVIGYTVANDISERYWQIEVSGGQWSKGKSGPGFLPLGPSLVPKSQVKASNLQLVSSVNGDIRQSSNTSDMIFDVATIVRDLSQFTVLEPGDVVLTGTPEGVALSGRFAYLKPGDKMRIEIENLGHQTQNVIKGK